MKRRKRRKRGLVIERDVKGAAHGAGIPAGHLTGGAAAHETTKGQEAETEDGAGTSVCVCVSLKYFQVNFQKVKVSWGLTVSLSNINDLLASLRCFFSSEDIPYWF